MAKADWYGFYQQQLQSRCEQKSELLQRLLRDVKFLEAYQLAMVIMERSAANGFCKVMKPTFGDQAIEVNAEI